MYTIFLFGLNDGNHLIQAGPGCIIYEMRFYTSDKLLMEFIPCVRKSDSKPGMYDTVTKTFYTNAGSGEFIVPA